MAAVVDVPETATAYVIPGVSPVNVYVKALGVVIWPNGTFPSPKITISQRSIWGAGEACLVQVTVIVVAVLDATVTIGAGCRAGPTM